MHRKGVGVHKESAKRTKGGVLASAIQLVDLRPYFSVSAEEASTQLGVGLTVLKRRCRELGVTRWPYRQIKCVEKLIEYLKTEEDVEGTDLNEKLRQLRHYREVILRGKSTQLPSWAKRSQQHLSKLNYRARVSKKERYVEKFDRPQRTPPNVVHTNRIKIENTKDEIPASDANTVSETEPGERQDVQSIHADSEGDLSQIGDWLTLQEAMMEIPPIEDGEPAIESAFEVYHERPQDRRGLNFEPYPFYPFPQRSPFHEDFKPTLMPVMPHPLAFRGPDEDQKTGVKRELEWYAHQRGYDVNSLDIISSHPRHNSLF